MPSCREYHIGFVGFVTVLFSEEKSTTYSFKYTYILHATLRPRLSLRYML